MLSGSGPDDSDQMKPVKLPPVMRSSSTAFSTGSTVARMPARASIGITASTMGEPQLSLALAITGRSMPSACPASASSALAFSTSSL